MALARARRGFQRLGSRVTRFTAEVRDELLEELRGGQALTDACELHGLSVDTVKGWLKRGRGEDDTDYSAFARAVEDARRMAAETEMTPDEFRGHVAAAVRRGSVTAMRLWWTAFGERDEPPADDPFEELDRQSSVTGRLEQRRPAGDGRNGCGQG